MPEPKQRLIVDGIEFDTVFRFHRILQSITAALQPGRLVVGLLMIAALMTAGRAWDRFSEPIVSPGGLLEGVMSESARSAAERTVRATLRGLAGAEGLEGAEGLSAAEALPLLENVWRRRAAAGEVDEDDWRAAWRRLDSGRPRGVFEATVTHVSAAFARTVHGLLTLDPAECVDRGLGDLVVRMPLVLWRDHRLFTVLFGLLSLVVVSFGGGTLSRMAACQWARQERIRLADAVDFAARNWWKLLWALLLPVLLAAVAASIVVLLGLLMRLPWIFDLLGALGYGVALVVGALIAFLVLGYALGLPLLVPAVTCENCDGPDAQQRAYAYVLNRPLHLIGYGAVALAGLAVAYLLLSGFIVLTLNATSVLFGLSSGSHDALGALGRFELFDLDPPLPAPPAAAAADEPARAVLIFWQTLVLSVVPAYVLSYFFTSSTKVYLLMRRACDGQDLDEIWLPGMVPGTYTPAPEREGAGG